MDWWRRLLPRVLRSPERDSGGPWPSETRIAFVAAWFEPCGAWPFPSFFDPRLAAFRPEVIAAPLPALLELAEATLHGTAAPPSLDMAVVSLTGVGRPVLRPAQRDLLWLALRVPVFEQFRGPAGQLLAWECEAHLGLHVETDRARFVVDKTNGELRMRLTEGSPAIPTGIQGRILTEQCRCGRPGPLLVQLRQLGEAEDRALATAV